MCSGGGGGGGQSVAQKAVEATPAIAAANPELTRADPTQNSGTGSDTATTAQTTRYDRSENTSSGLGTTSGSGLRM